MIHAETHSSVTPPRETDAFLVVLDQLSTRDRRILGRLVQSLAVVEGSHGEAVALAVAEQMEVILRDRQAA
jgi:hypothetical protein